MSKKTFKHGKTDGPIKSALLGIGGVLVVLAGFGLWAEGTAAILPALKIGGTGAVILAIGALIPSKDQYTQR